MPTYTVFNGAPANIQSSQFFQSAGNVSLTSWTPTSIVLTNITGTIVSIAGTGFNLDGNDEPTAGTVGSITLFAADFSTQLAIFGALSVPLVDLYGVWLGASPGNVSAFLLGGDDTLTGGSSDDNLGGYGGADALSGNGGNDYLDPGRGTDTIDGGDGEDMLSYSAANGSGTITAGITVDLNAATVIDPWGDTDTITSIERVRGTRFADTLTGTAGDNRFEGLGGADIITGGGGQDRIAYNRDASFGGSAGVVVDLAAGTATDGFGAKDSFTGIEEVTGTDSGDILFGGDTPLPNNQAYEIYALGGDDSITAGKFDLYVEPGAGSDTITAGTGFDQISYAEYVGPNGATFDLAAGTISDPYGGTDTLVGAIEGARGTRNADIFTGNALNNQFRGLGGNDSFDGGAGQDRVRYDRDAQYGGSAGVTVNLATGTATDGFGTTDTLVSIEQVTGTDQADNLTGGDAALALGQTYELYGRAGDDVLTGGAFAAYIEPGAGNDTITGGTGNADQISYSDYTGAGILVANLDLGTLADPYGGTDNFTGIEGLRGTQNADSLTGDGAGNFFVGLGGADIIDGGGGTDLVRYDRDAQFGGAAGVLVDLAAGTGRDGFGTTDTLMSIESIRGTNALTGSTASLDGGATLTSFGDVLYGNDEANRFQALGGDDLIDGRGGVDTVDYVRDATVGGGGAVTVNLATGSAIDGFGNTDRLVSIENVVGTDLGDSITGDNADNVLQGGLGDDTIDGGGGSNTAVFSGNLAAYTVAASSFANGTVTGADGKDTLANIQFLKFSDQTVAFGTPDPVTLAIAATDADKAEGAGGAATVFTFTVTRTGSTAGALDVGYSVGGGALRPADAADFTGGALPGGTISFAAGEGSKVLTIEVSGDDVVEGNESFVVTLANPPAGATLGTASAGGTILADEAITDLAVVNGTTGLPVAATPVFYTGPVAGIEREFVLLTPENLTVAVAGPNWFIHSGSGDDAIAVAGGTNVLDGGTGSNFLTGASGADTFFVDARGATAPIWSTVNGFSSGDAATLWGVSKAAFALDWFDDQGAPGFTGLTLHATAAGKPTASLTLPGYTKAQMDGGALTVLFGFDPGSGSDYMYVLAN